MSRRNTIQSFLNLTPSGRVKISRRLPPRFSPMSSSSTSRSSNTKDQGGEDPHDLARFVTAQNRHDTYRQALREICSGGKRSHWMWFVFPQLSGLAQFPSPMAQRYAIGSLEEAKAYLAHPVLGRRLKEISGEVLGSRTENVGELMGSEVDVDKLRSCMTLFGRVVQGKREEGDEVFEGLLKRWFDGKEDEKTLERLEGKDG